MKYCPCKEWRDNIDYFEVPLWADVPKPVFCAWCGNKLVTLEGVNKPVEHLTEEDLKGIKV